VPEIPFSVDSALLEELGKKLVGKPYIALAELIKNSYDADSKKVIISINQSKDEISVTDFGNGMTLKEFIDYWMRIGSTHKLKQKYSRNLHRPLTGSKGVGRLAVQFLAKKMTLYTVSEYNLNEKLEASLLWENAVNKGNLTEATINYDIFVANNNLKGTKIILTGLEQKWTQKDIEKLTKEIWWLKSPFKKTILDTENEDFNIVFESSDPFFVKKFNEEIDVIMDIWQTKIVGENNKGHVNLSVQFIGEDPIPWTFIINDCLLDYASFEIRIFNLTDRQPKGIKVEEARDYFDDYGGIHVYDGGFHLPYYGDRKNDWVGLEQYHSHRRISAQLLPEELREKGNMQNLPTLTRVFGVVNVNTSKEIDLKILITRDRLQETEAFKNLQDMILKSLEYYAYLVTLRKLDIKKSSSEIESPEIKDVEEVVEKYKNEIPSDTYKQIISEVKNISSKIESENQKIAKQVSLVGSLSTAGMTALAANHETKKQYLELDEIVFKLSEVKNEINDPIIKKELVTIQERLIQWINKIRSINKLFDYLGSADSIQDRKRYYARTILEDVKSQLTSLVRDVEIIIIPIDNILLPKASYSEWGAIFQNVIINAFNAVMESKIKKIQISVKKSGKDCEILIQDTGIGVDLATSEELFEPFVRKIMLSPERQSLGYGGMGLGLTIVRLIASNIGCRVAFMVPEKGFNTAFVLSWRDQY
jgi:hypothetical protein